jgi:hypothetical protein
MGAISKWLTEELCSNSCSFTSFLASLKQATSPLGADAKKKVKETDFQAFSGSDSQRYKLQFFLTHFVSHLSTTSFPLQLIKSSEEKTDN